MNVTHENSDALNALLTVKVEKNDYEQNVEKALKDIRKNAVIKGFRPGKAPAGMINRMYGKSTLVEEVNKLISENLSGYITEQKLDILGEPIPSEKQQPIDFDEQDDFEFLFDLAFAPEFEIKLSKRDKVPYYNIMVSDEMRQSYIENIVGRYGSYEDAEEADGESLLKATLTELNADESPKEDGISVEEGMVSVALVADEEEKEKCIGTKVGDVMVIDVTKAFPNETDRAALLKVSKEDLDEIGPLFQATVAQVQKYLKAEVNQELFDNIYGEGVVKSEEEFKEKVDEDIKQNLKGNSEQKLHIDLREKLVKKFNLELPKEFLIRWLTTINEGKFTREQVEKDYPNFEDDLRWQLIRDKIAVEQEFKVEEQELMHVAKGHLMHQMMQYGMGQLPDEFIDKYAKELVEKPEERRKMAEQVIEGKVMEWIKETIKLDEKEIDSEEFRKMVNPEAK
ncbi:MAG: trigger factor [Bacteroidales bacterium]|jgi:trigger factor|nr:trigger factor [Bacteroidales bacterium]MDD4671583.1 trigger factor [Bacteroidales bacterium]